MPTCIPSHRLKRSWHSCPRWVNASNKNMTSMHHPQRPNVTTSMVGLKNGHIRKNLTKSHEPQRYSWEDRGRRRIQNTRHLAEQPLAHQPLSLVHWPAEPGAEPGYPLLEADSSPLGGWGICPDSRSGRSPRYPQSRYTSNLRTGALPTSLSNAWHYKVSARTGWPGVCDWVSWQVGSAPSISA